MIDDKNVIETVANGCEVTLLFKKEPNQQAQQNIIDMLLYSYDKRMDSTIESTSNSLTN